MKLLKNMKVMMMTELKPCPFCSSNAHIDRFLNGNNFLIYRPECSKCSCQIGASTDESDSIKWWNTRAPCDKYEKLLAFVTARAILGEDIEEEKKRVFLSEHEAYVCGYNHRSCLIAEEARKLLKEIGESE